MPAIRRRLANVPPDLFRLRHWQALAEVIAAIVRNGEPATVPDAEREHFVQLVLTEFKALHAGNAVRFGIGALEWEGWRSNDGCYRNKSG